MVRSLDERRRAEPTALPAWIKPQLTKLVDQPPEGPEWLHELKFDGYRMHAGLDRGAVWLLTRTGLDWTAKYPTIAASIASLPARQAYLDGELCGVRPDGTTSFSLIQNASDTGNSGALVFFLFDLIHQNGEAIGPLPLAERKERLASCLGCRLAAPFQRSPDRARAGFLRSCLHPESGRDRFEAGRCALRCRLEGDGALGTDGLHDSPLEEPVTSEPVSGSAKFPC